MTLLRPRHEPQNVLHTTSFESALGLSPLFVREIRPIITLYDTRAYLTSPRNGSPRCLRAVSPFSSVRCRSGISPRSPS